MEWSSAGPENMRSTCRSASGSIKDRLQILGCPHVVDLDEEAVTDLVFSPGRDRLEILQWLFTEFDPKLVDFLDSSGQGTLGLRTDTKEKRLLEVARALLVCSGDDISLIKGDAPQTQQVAFWNRLLDLCTQKLSANSVVRPNPSKFIDDLARTGFISHVNACWKPDLLPKDIRSELSKDLDRSRVPSLKSLMEQSDELSVEIKRYTEELVKLQTILIVPSQDQSSELLTMTQMLSTLVRELGQLVSGFSHCFEARLALWCQRSPPHLSQLGPTLARVHSKLDTFIKLFENLHSIRTLQTRLHKEEPSQEVKLALVSEEDADKLQKCLPVLEESLHRNEASFTSKFEELLSKTNFRSS